jgi:hypothetical protein
MHLVPHPDDSFTTTTTLSSWHLPKGRKKIAEIIEAGRPTYIQPRQSEITLRGRWNGGGITGRSEMVEGGQVLKGSWPEDDGVGQPIRRGRKEQKVYQMIEVWLRSEL